jgi:hypothetical protein
MTTHGRTMPQHNTTHPRPAHSPTVPTEHAQPHARHHAAIEGSAPFSQLMSEVMASAERFGHRQHIQLTWLAVRRYGTIPAIDLVSDGIQNVARYQGAPQKYNATVSRAWVELVGHHAKRSHAADFDAFAEQNNALLDKKLLTRFYRSSTLASGAARTGWIEPDLRSFPWQSADTPPRLGS